MVEILLLSFYYNKKRKKSIVVRVSADCNKRHIFNAMKNPTCEIDYCRKLTLKSLNVNNMVYNI